MKIIIVEDDVLLQKVYLEVLQKEGFSPVIAPDGPSCMKILQTESVALILLDIMLPGGMNGFDVLRRLNQNPKYKEIPVIVLSNLDSERQACLDAGAVDYVIKSAYDVNSIVAKIRSHLPDFTPAA